MNGIDTALASLLASRVDSLTSIAPAGAATSQTGATGVGRPVVPTTLTPPAAPPPASAQTALSPVAQTLNAIALAGGEAAGAVLGELPIWAAAPAIDVEAGALPLFDGNGAASAASTSAANAATAAQGATHVAAAPLPVAQLAAALARTVDESGLFYEAHLAQWLSGQYSPSDLANEPQNRLASNGTQLQFDWADDGGGAASSSGSNAAQGNARASAGDASAAMRGGSIHTPQAARFAAAEVLADSLVDGPAQPSHSAAHGAAGATVNNADGANGNGAAQTLAAAVHPATVPLVRQQLDLLATGQFRWSGEAWPGARLEWTIEQDGDEWQRSGGGADSAGTEPWRTRLTLSLPSLGTVDAELVLSGTQLLARVQANSDGAARLSAEGEQFRRRLSAAGIQLTGLSIRETGGDVPPAQAGAAASAYAAAAAAASTRGRSGAADQAGRSASARNDDDFDWDM